MKTTQPQSTLIIRGSDKQYIPASHEDPKNPGVLKKILLDKGVHLHGLISMVNWAKLPAGKSFQAHYHEDMSEVFIIMKGAVEIRCNNQRDTLAVGDLLLVPPHVIHTFMNTSDGDVEYVVFGVSSEENGKTVNVP